MATTVGVKSGDWMNYTITASAMGQSFQGSAKVTINSVSGTTVSGTLEMNVAGFYTLPPTPFSINVATGAGTGGNAFLIIPVNLTQGQSIPGLSTSVTGVTNRSYVGASRNVVYATADVSGYGTMSLYWDRYTGILLEMSGSTTSGGYTVNISFTASGTNMWAGTGIGPFGIDPLLLVIIAIIIVGAIAGIFLLVRRRKPPVAPLPPQAQPPTPPPPPTSVT